MDTEPLVSIVVPIYNDVQRLDSLVTSLKNQSFDGYEVVVVDDRSTDGTWEMLSGMTGESLRVFRSPRNLGSGFCRNLGVSMARGVVIAFTDSDCVPEEGWLGKISGPVLDGTADASMGPNHICLHDNRRCRLESIRAKQYWGMDTKNMSIKKEVFSELGGFREDIKVNVDWEFNQRFMSAGYNVSFVEAVVLHDFPDDPIGVILKTRRRGREESKVYGKSMGTLQVLRLTGRRILGKFSRSPGIWSEGKDIAESTALVMYYLSFHFLWTASLAVSLFFPGERRN